MDEFENLTFEMIASDIIFLVIAEIECLREEFGSEDRILTRQAIESSFTPYFQRIGKAAAYFALYHMRYVKLSMKPHIEYVHYASSLTESLNAFTRNFFRRTDKTEKNWCLRVLLYFFGAMGAIADCCNVLEKPRFVQVCINNLERCLIACSIALRNAGGWQSLYDEAEEYAVAYDLKFLENRINAARVLQD